MKTITITLLFTVLSVFTLKAQQSYKYPEARRDATFVKVGAVYILFGGRTTSKGKNSKSAKALFLDSTYMFDHSGNNWKKLKHSPSTTPPSGRSNHAAVSWNGKMYIRGGETANGLTNEIWEFNPVTKYWTNVTPSSNNFTPRKNLAAVIIGNKLYIAGGEDASGNALNDAYAVDMNNHTSTQIANLPGSSPASIGAAGASLDSSFYMFGGYNDYGSTNSNIHYNATTQAWDMSFNTDFHTGFAGIANVSDIMAFIWGGMSTSKDVYETALYSYNVQTGQQKLIRNNMPAGKYFNCGIVEIDSLSKSTPDTLLYFWGGSDNQSFFKYSLVQDTILRYDTIAHEFSTGIMNHKINDNTISAYPNPAHNQITICSKLTQINTYTLLDINSKIIRQNTVNNKTVKLDISGLTKGVYILRLYTDIGVMNKKIIKQ